MIYAKSKPIESLKEHTNKLIRNYYLLQECYGRKIQNPQMWNMLLTAVRYHDAGKIYCQFQNKIIENIRKEYKVDIQGVEQIVDYDLPHNYLSPAFLPHYKDLDLSKKEFQVLVQAIAYHHERNQEPDTLKIRDIIEQDLQYKIENVRNELLVEVPDKLMSQYTAYISSLKRIKSDDENYFLYVLIKGLLHRIDHSASASLQDYFEEIERDVNKNVAQYTSDYLTRKNYPLRDVQIFSQNNKEKNLIVVASTGMGKTESALLWIDNDKAFFTLPLRVSINALYDRVTKKEDIEKKEDGMGYEYTGLLHSTSMDHLDEAGYENWEEIYDHSRILSSKLTFTTIDQIFKFPFKYRGYEKLYATMAYSKVVIDEIQAYSPDIAAVLLKGLEMIHQIGGKFMIMTATLPKLYIQTLQERGVLTQDDFVMGEYLSDRIRHKIEVKDKAIMSDIDEIIKRGKEKKVLVIVNTVDRAIELYGELSRTGEADVYLLHSLFIQKHRSYLERQIKDFANMSDTKGIWITTQIVEASLDVDFDYLFTELSALDSLFQRLGRCYRKRKFDLSEPNVYIYTEEVKGIGTIYDKDIWNMSKAAITEYNFKELSERDKVNMVDHLYSEENLKETRFLKTFKNALSFLDTNNDYELSSNEAQRVLRDIESINTIPREIYESIDDLLQKYKAEADKNERKRLRREISKYTVNVPLYKVKKNKGAVSPINIAGLENFVILEREYDFPEDIMKGKGVIVDEALSNMF
ncbi:CRISPR-associated helicase Cas3' [Geosporobacter ferrireducens]|uniref:CRISPR-associated helicase Cas3' n=1 Tax=Geosporobacter ferrireducens TaxID=1424294 RepID=UPI00139C1B6D|nr:CRISPR-associated helicase Cas3' [Geosporobacter ferrireducens]MTI53564.1 CRISPR-associated helicase Cas3' [Geosporobacter ferrireducens]